MSILTRDALGDGSLRKRLTQSLPPGLTWTEAQIEASLDDTLAQRPPGPVWVFGYGSLMWNPLLEVVDRRVATLEGWHRSFCLRTVVGRGCPETPGRMLSLQAGGCVQGLALQMPEPEDALRHELRLLWRREMAMGSYRPLWAAARCPQGDELPVLVFVANADHPMHEADDSVPAVARQVATAEGAFGRNVEYLRALQRALAELGLQDAAVDALAAAVDALSPGAPGSPAPGR